MKVNTFRFPKGGLGGFFPEAEDFFLKIKQDEGFSFKLRFFSFFCRAPQIPKTMSLLPKSLIKITNAPKLSEMNSHSSQIPLIPGGHTSLWYQITFHLSHIALFFYQAKYCMEIRLRCVRSTCEFGTYRIDKIRRQSRACANARSR